MDRKTIINHIGELFNEFARRRYHVGADYDDDNEFNCIAIWDWDDLAGKLADYLLPNYPDEVEKK